MGAKRRLWRCPRCGHRFVTRNVWHSCGRHRLDTHFAGADPTVREVFDALATQVRAIGPVTVYAQQTRIVFQGRVRFLSATPRRRWLDGAMWLTRRGSHPLFRRIVRYAPNALGHHFRLTAPTDLDERFVTLLREAYAIGQQAHVR